MAEPQTPELSHYQIAQLQLAVAAWADNHPHPDYPAFVLGDSLFSPRDLQRELAEDGPIGRQFLRMTRFALEVESFDNLLQRFMRGSAVT
jgi:hypothetical protein